ncbi:O-linked N-acetylglucosamine transferase, SPINDLY family protein [Leisingera sp. ANG-M7]|uniref:O-linked N-acetylglucosamine transferase, SPINDLY family protein n=1 Tax=Leisingera sp. ANG-M7 TaxID=1577902 RepID=UPI000ADA78EE|nr:UDP-N-acetylglucosamine-peptide N-acetylglucosaminyltransferase [Leisingera sp. ANG-M7]
MAMRHGLLKSNDVPVREQVVRLMKLSRRKAVERSFKDAVYLMEQALELDPKNRSIHTALGEIYELMEKRDKAILCHVEALRLEPQNPECLAYIGSYLMRIGQDEEAINYFQDCLKFAPSNEVVFARMMHLKRRKCDWSEFGKARKKIKNFSKVMKAIDPFSFLSVVDDPEMQKQYSVLAANANKVCKEETASFTAPLAKKDKIRIGYFSCDFLDHATMYLIGRMFELHDRDRFEIYIYDYGAMTQQQGRLRAEQSADVYRQVGGVASEIIVEQARADGLDIAIDLKGHTKGNRINLFDHRMAPVQISYLGYPGTSGVDAIDYMIADPVVVPPKYRKHYTEKVLYMPDCYQSNDDSRKASEDLPTRADVGLPEDALVFCSFNSPYKVSPEEFDIWMKLMKLVPDSVLWFYAAHDDIRDNIRVEAKRRGVSPDRIVFAGFAQQAEHLARLPLADVFLDTFAVNAHTTASDALWAGVPVVTKVGKQFAARVAASLLHSVGMDELTTTTPQQYQALALKLARDKDYLADVKARVRQGIETGPLYDTEKFTRNFEALLEKTLERFNAGLKPDHISLS